MANELQKIEREVHRDVEEIEEKIQTSETFLLSAILALSGGFQDAYTYNVRDKVFSNAQTGNVVLMSQHMMMGEWGRALHYLFPVIAFALGVLVAEQIGHKYKMAKKVHWRQIIVAIEFVILFAVGFIPSGYNMIATMLVSFACSMQVQAFRKVHGYGYASTMCIGNLRSGTESLSVYLRDEKSGTLLWNYPDICDRCRNRRNLFHTYGNEVHLGIQCTIDSGMHDDGSGEEIVSDLCENMV